MEGVGSRLGRASSRYGPAATVFNGPVRKWKKRWVHVSSSPSSTLSYQNPQSQSNGTPRLLLCRWTPLPPTTTGAADGSGGSPLDEPPRRKFRYTPVSKRLHTRVLCIRVYGFLFIYLLKKKELDYAHANEFWGFFFWV